MRARGQGYGEFAKQVSSLLLSAYTAPRPGACCVSCAWLRSGKRTLLVLQGLRAERALSREGGRPWRACYMLPVCLQTPRADARASLLPRAWAPLIHRVCLHACALVFASGRHHRRWPARQGALARHWRALRQRTQWWTPMPMPSTTTVSPESAFPHTPRVVR